MRFQNISQLKMQFRVEIMTAEFRLLMSRPTPKHGFKKIREITPGEILTGISFLPWPTLTLFFKLLSMLPILTILIVFLTFFRITQHLISLTDLLKFLMRLFVIGVQIRMKLPGKLSVSFFYIVSGRIFIDL